MKEKLFSLAYLTLPGTHPLDQIQIAALCGYQGVGLRTLSQNWPTDKTWSLSNPDLFKEIKNTLHDTGIKLFDIELGRIASGVSVSDFETDFAKAEELGAQYVTASVWTDDQLFAKSEFKKMAKLAALYHLTLAVEFVPFSAIKDLGQTLQWMAEVQEPNVKILVDVLHAYRTGITATQLQKLRPNQIGCVHLCDGPAFIPPLGHPDMIGVTRSGRLYPGDGAIPIHKILKNMPLPPYYAIELPNQEEMAKRGKIGHAKNCLERMKAYFQKYNL